MNEAYQGRYGSVEAIDCLGLRDMKIVDRKVVVFSAPTWLKEYPSTLRGSMAQIADPESPKLLSLRDHAEPGVFALQGCRPSSFQVCGYVLSSGNIANKV